MAAAQGSDFGSDNKETTSPAGVEFTNGDQPRARLGNRECAWIGMPSSKYLPNLTLPSNRSIDSFFLLILNLP